MRRQTLVGILLAAGRGRRMGQTKQLLPWRGDCGESLPLVAAAFDAIAPVCDTLMVVLGHEADCVAQALAPREFRAVVADPDAAMFESVRAGVRAALECDPHANGLLQLADHPSVAPQTLDALLESLATDSGRAVIPTHAGQGGHPVLIPNALLPCIVTWEGTQGLRGFWKQHHQSVQRLAVPDPSVIQDMDTPEDWPQC